MAPYHKLRCRMREFEFKQEDVARKLLLGTAAVGNKLNARSDWRLEEMYLLMELLRIPYTEMHIYFPRRGQNETGCDHGRLRRTKYGAAEKRK